MNTSLSFSNFEIRLRVKTLVTSGSNEASQIYIIIWDLLKVLLTQFVSFELPAISKAPYFQMVLNSDHS